MTEYLFGASAQSSQPPIEIYPKQLLNVGPHTLAPSHFQVGQFASDIHKKENKLIYSLQNNSAQNLEKGVNTITQIPHKSSKYHSCPQEYSFSQIPDIQQSNNAILFEHPTLPMPISHFNEDMSHNQPNNLKISNQSNGVVSPTHHSQAKSIEDILAAYKSESLKNISKTDELVNQQKIQNNFGLPQGSGNLFEQIPLREKSVDEILSEFKQPVFKDIKGLSQSSGAQKRGNQQRNAVTQRNLSGSCLPSQSRHVRQIILDNVCEKKESHSLHIEPYQGYSQMKEEGFSVNLDGQLFNRNDMQQRQLLQAVKNNTEDIPAKYRSHSEMNILANSNNQRDASGNMLPSFKSQFSRFKSDLIAEYRPSSSPFISIQPQMKFSDIIKNSLQLSGLQSDFLTQFKQTSPEKISSDAIKGRLNENIKADKSTDDIIEQIRAQNQRQFIECCNSQESSVKRAKIDQHSNINGITAQINSRSVEPEFPPISNYIEEIVNRIQSSNSINSVNQISTGKTGQKSIPPPQQQLPLSNSRGIHANGEVKLRKQLDSFENLLRDQEQLRTSCNPTKRIPTEFSNMVRRVDSEFTPDQQFTSFSQNYYLGDDNSSVQKSKNLSDLRSISNQISANNSVMERQQQQRSSQLEEVANTLNQITQDAYPFDYMRKSDRIQEQRKEKAQRLICDFIQVKFT